MKTLLSTVLAIFWMSAAHACDTPDVGDQLRYKNGPVLEVVKLKNPACILHLCVRPVGSPQSCRWLTLDTDEKFIAANWITFHKEKQTSTLDCDHLPPDYPRQPNGVPYGCEK